MSAASVWFTHGGQLVTERVTGVEIVWAHKVADPFRDLLRKPTPLVTDCVLLPEFDGHELAVIRDPDGRFMLRELDFSTAGESWRLSHERAMELRSACCILDPRGEESVTAALSAIAETWGPVNRRMQHIMARVDDARTAAVLYHDGGLDGPPPPPPSIHWKCDRCPDGRATYFGPDPVEFEQGDPGRVQLCEGCYDQRLALVPD